MISFIHGFATGWLSGVILTLESPLDTPLESGPITSIRRSWLGGLISIGGLFGNVLFTVLGSYVGQKISVILLAIPNLVALQNDKSFEHDLVE